MDARHISHANSITTHMLRQSCDYNQETCTATTLRSQRTLKKSDGQNDFNWTRGREKKDEESDSRGQSGKRFNGQKKI
ncbi:uncharacterized protein V6R79_002813 [Siganus canaliculatus]